MRFPRKMVHHCVSPVEKSKFLLREVSVRKDLLPSAVLITES